MKRHGKMQIINFMIWSKGKLFIQVPSRQKIDKNKAVIQEQIFSQQRLMYQYQRIVLSFIKMNFQFLWDKFQQHSKIQIEEI